MLNEYIHDQKLIVLFTQLSGFAGAEPDQVSALFFAMMWNSYHHGGFYYFVGGSQAVSNALAEVIRENGGEIKLNTLATKIVIENGRAVAVQTQDGSVYKCRYVVSNANAPQTFFKLVGKEYLPKAYVKKLENLKIGMSAYVVYLGVNKDYSEYFPKGLHELMITESYDQHENFEYYRQGIPEKAPFFITNYSLVDPTAAPPGKNVISLTILMPYDYKGDWYESQSYEKYRALKEEVAWVLIKRTEKYLPDLSKHIEFMEVGSPRTMEHFTLNPKGTIFGWDNTPEQSMFKRLPNKTPIPNLYLAGAWTFPGGGQSAVIASGTIAGKMILMEDKYRK
jgi:prolycopene isomerase